MLRGMGQHISRQLRQSRGYMGEVGRPNSEYHMGCHDCLARSQIQLKRGIQPTDRDYLYLFDFWYLVLLEPQPVPDKGIQRYWYCLVTVGQIILCAVVLQRVATGWV